MSCKKNDTIRKKKEQLLTDVLTVMYSMYVKSFLYCEGYIKSVSRSLLSRQMLEYLCSMMKAYLLVNLFAISTLHKCLHK